MNKRFFSDALAEANGFVTENMSIEKLFSMKLLGDTINTFMDICNIEASCLAKVIPVKCKADGSNYIFELEFLAVLISGTDSNIIIGKDGIEFTIKAPVLKRKQMKISGSFNGLSFQFVATIDKDFHRLLEHVIVLNRQDGKRFKVKKSQSDYSSNSEYRNSFDVDVIDAKEFVAGNENIDTGAKRPKRKTGVY